FADDIRRHLDGFPVRARREGLPYVAGRFLRRNAFPVAAAASIVLLVTVLGVSSAIFAVKAAEQAREVSRERDRAEEIAHFMRELFEIANPAAVSGETVTARELLDHGIEKIRADHADEPALQAEMMTVLGTVYQHLGLREDALALLQEAEFVQRGLPGVHPEERAATLLALGRALLESNQAAGSLPVVRRARDLLSSEAEVPRAEVVQAGLTVAEALRATGDAAAARTETQRALSTFRTMPKASGAEYLETLMALAHGLLAVAEVREAEPLYRQALAMAQEHHGRFHPDIPPLLLGLADVAAATDRPQEATTLLRQAVAVSSALAQEDAGGTSQELGRAYLALGRQLLRNGDADEAHQAMDAAARHLGAAADPDADEALSLLARSIPVTPR
ncbi:MAG TPA: tetratricopeptide repeat protein, partial [Longimicrobiales bacterium]|nr:tetratricopeptide repeat protein [Longimicrobiales bacterium]